MAKRSRTAPYDVRCLAIHDTNVEIYAGAETNPTPSISLWAVMDAPVLRAQNAELKVSLWQGDGDARGVALGVTEDYWRLYSNFTIEQFYALLCLVVTGQPIHAQVMLDRISRGKATIRSVVLATKPFE